MKNRILLINNGYPNYENKNYCTYIKSIKECLEECENVALVDVLTIDLSKNKINGYIDFYIRILKLDISKYDILYINHWSDIYYPFIFKNIKNKKIIINYHGSDLVSSNKFKKLNNSIGLNLIPRNSEVIVPSDYFKKIISRKIINNISIIPSGGIDTKIFYKYKSKYRENDKIKIGFCSGLTYGKGYDILMKIAKGLESNSSNIEFHIIRYGDKLADFEKYIEENNLGKYIKYYSILEKCEMPGYYNNIDYLLLPTRSESLGLVALEAMACGTPVIGTNDFAIPEYIKDNINGFLFNIDQIEEILDKINSFNKLNNYYNELSESAIIEVKNRYSKEICKVSYFNLINKF